MMNEKSLEMLEFPKVREILAGYTSFSASHELALSLRPRTDLESVALLLKQSAEARHILSIRPGFSAGDLIDVRQPARLSAAGSMLEIKDLLNVLRMLAATRNLRQSLAKLSAEAPALWALADGIVELPALEADIGRSISPAAEVLDSASPRLASTRHRLRQAKQDLLNRLQAFITSARGQKVVQETIITEREGRYVIPVKIEHRKEVKGIVHDTSNTGQTLFIEPWMTVDLGNELRQLAVEERHEVERILSTLSGQVGADEAAISRNVALAADLDLAFAKARYAEGAAAIEPFLECAAPASDSPRVCRLVNARHPLLRGEVVPLSIEIGKDFSVLVVSGPNTGGKTVALKTIGLLAIMVQSGIPIPVSEGACLPIFDAVFADIGDEQSIEQTLSTFSWHMGNIVRIIKESTSLSLVLLDELGASTDPEEGTALARAILQHFRDKGAMTVATTHYSDIKMAAQTTPGLQNASLDFDPVTLYPTYHLTVGVPGASNAMAIASRLGLPANLVSLARELQSKGAAETETVLRGLALEREKAAAAGARLQREEQEMRARRQQFEAEINGLRQKEQAALDEVRQKLVEEAANLRREIRQAAAELRKTTSKKAVERARKALNSFHHQLAAQEAPRAPETPALACPSELLSVGDKVWLSDVGVWGAVTALLQDEHEVEVQVGNARLRLDAEEVEKKTDAGESVREFAVVKTSDRNRVASLELDLRGKRADAVEPELDAYLNNAFLAHLPQVRIIHGFGSGTVRQIVRTLLASHPLVKSFHPGGRTEGGDGVTMVSLSTRS